MNIKWEKKDIKTDSGFCNGICPIIVSASRSTDIPAFYSDWLLNRLNAGYAKWVNPFNRKQHQVVSFEKTRVFVFWTKNPQPILKQLKTIDDLGYNYYFQFTLNDYENEDLEPNVPLLNKRLETFKELSKIIGKEKVIWRFDPLLLTDKIGVNDLITKIQKVGNEIHNYTEKLVISFADIENYRSVQNKLKSAKISYKNFTDNDISEICEKLNELNKKWNLEISTCAEIVDLDKYGITHNKCIDDELMAKVFSKDKELMKFIGYETYSLFNESNNSSINLKDKGQRKECGCIISKDIGQYNTCPHICRYCYANVSEKSALNNSKKVTQSGDSLIK
jgi:DNA repair photolyase